MAGYRGFEGNAGSPDETGLLRDARATLDWLAARGIAGVDLIVYGESLGSGIAVRMASERPVGAIILEAAYTSTGRGIIAWSGRTAVRAAFVNGRSIGTPQDLAPIPSSPDDIAANTFPGADRVFQPRLALGRRIARGSSERRRRM